MEVLMVTFIVGVLSTVILLNYRTGQTGILLTRAASAFESNIRRAQNLAIASAEFGGSVPCGYGIRYVDSRTYAIYAGGLGGAANCQSSNHNFESGTDSVFDTIKIIESTVILKNAFSDIFFEPPDPATYINNSKAAGASTTVELCLESDLAKCRSLIIDFAGKISIQ